ncbi:MAG: trypsin-like peptidase domain-containing protein [Ardenticatenaceae bacterium]
MSELLVNQLLEQATCAVLEGGEIKGTAWLVGDEGHLLTAEHVVAQCKRWAEVEVLFVGDVPRKARKLDGELAPHKGIDFAVLKLPNIPPKRQPLPILLKKSVEGPIRLRGYGESLNKRHAQWGGTGEFVASIPLQNSRSKVIFQVKSKGLRDKGFSGGAVYSDKLGAVVAILIEYGKNPFDETVLAMPLYRIANMWQPLKKWAGLSPSRQPKPPPTPTPLSNNWPPEVQSALNERFQRHCELILGTAPYDSSLRRQLDRLYGAFFGKPPDLNTIQSTLAFFTEHRPSALRPVKTLLQDPTLQWLVRQGGEQMTQRYERLAFAAPATLQRYG